MNTLKLNFVRMALAIPAVLMAAQACTDGKSEGNSVPPASAPVPVKVMTPERTVTRPVIEASGQLTTDDETVLSFKTGGVVSAVGVKEGDRVRKGQLLASLDLTEINASVAQARFAFEKAERDFQRAQNLYRDSVATLEQLQNAQTARSLAGEQLEAATFNRSYSAIHAPADGYVLRKFLNAGQVIKPGDPVLMTNGAVKGRWILKTGVSDRQWAAVKLQDEAEINVDAFPGKTFQAFVVRKSGTSDPMTGAFTVELQLKDNDVKMASGMFGKATIRTREEKTTWSVPYDAVLDANGNTGFVFVTHDQKTALRQPVTIESFNENTIQVSEGLENAGALIVSGSAYLTDKASIYIIK